MRSQTTARLCQQPSATVAKCFRGVRVKKARYHCGNRPGLSCLAEGSAKPQLEPIPLILLWIRVP